MLALSTFPPLSADSEPPEVTSVTSSSRAPQSSGLQAERTGVPQRLLGPAPPRPFSLPCSHSSQPVMLPTSGSTHLARIRGAGPVSGTLF